MRTPLQALDAACALYGTQEAFADALTAATPENPVTSASISGWRQRGVVPDDRCEPIEAITHGQVTVEELGPHLVWRRDAKGRVVERGVRVKRTPRPRAGQGKRLHRRPPSRVQPGPR